MGIKPNKNNVCDACKNAHKLLRPVSYMNSNKDTIEVKQKIMWLCEWCYPKHNNKQDFRWWY